MTQPRSDHAGASREILGRGLIYTVGTAAPILANLLVTPVLTKVLAGAEFGLVSGGLVVLQVAMMLGGLGFAASITRHGLIESSGVAGASALTWRGSAIGAALCLVAMVGAAPLAAALRLTTMTVLLALVAAAGFVAMANAQAFLRVVDRPVAFVALSFIAALGGPALGLALALAGSATATWYLTGMAVGYGAAGLIGLVLTWRAARPAAHAGDLRRALDVGLPAVPHAVSLYLASGALVLVANHLFGAVDGGRLYYAVLLGSAPAVLTTSLNNAWAPVVYRAPAERWAGLIEHTGRDIAWITACAAGFMAATAPWLLRVVGNPSLSPAAMTPATAFIAAGTVLSVAYLGSVHLVFASGRSRGLAVSTPASLLIGVVAAVLLGRALGLQWVGAGMTVTYAALAVLTYAVARAATPVRWRPAAFALPLAAGLALCAVGGIAPTAGPVGLVARAVIAVACVAGAFATMQRVRRA